MGRLKQVLIVVVALVLTFTLVLAANGTMAQTDASAQVRFVHVIPAAAGFDVFIDGQLTVSDLEFGTASNYIHVPAGSHQITVTPAGLTTALWQQQIDVAAGSAITLIAASTNPLMFSTFQDDVTPVEVGKARLLVIHAIANGPAVDVLLAQGDRIITNLQFNQSFGPFDIPSAVYEMGVTTTGGTLDSAILPAQPFAFDSSTRYMLIAYGTPTSPSALLLSTPSTAQGDAGFVRLAHTVGGAPAVDIYLNGTLVVPSLAFGEVTEHMPVPVGDYQVTVRAAGTTADLISADLKVESGKAVTAVALGTAEQLALQIFTDNISGINADMALASIINTIPGDSSVSVTLADGTVLAENVPFGEAGDVVNLTPGRLGATVTLQVGDRSGSFEIPAAAFYGGVYYNGLVLSGDAFNPPSLVFKPTGLAQGIASAPGAGERVLAVAAAPTQPAASSEVVTPEPTQPPAVQPTVPPPTAVPTQPQPAPVVTTAPSLPTAYVILAPDARLQLREYPGPDFRSLGLVPSGATLLVNGRQGPAVSLSGVETTPEPESTEVLDPAALLGEKEDLLPEQTWLYITYNTPDGGQIYAWINALYVDVRTPNNDRQRLADLPLIPSSQYGYAVNTAITPPPVREDRVTVKVINLAGTTTLNVRRTPTTDGERLTGLPNGTVVEFVGLKGDGEWVFIRYLPPEGGVITGWISAQYAELQLNEKRVTAEELEAKKLLTITPDDQRGEIGAGAVPAAIPTRNPIKDVFVAEPTGLNPDANLNLRRSPDVNAEVIGKIPNGTRLIISTRTADGQWLKTTFEGQVGWIATEFVILTFNGAAVDVISVPLDESALPEATLEATPTG